MFHKLIYRKLQEKITTVIKKVKDDVSKEYVETIKCAKSIEEVEEMVLINKL